MTPARRVLALLLACAVVFGQWAYFAHALSHAKHDLAVAVYSSHGHGGGEHPAPLDHSPDQCVAFAGLDCGVATPQPSPASAPFFAFFSPARRQAFLRAAEPVPFSSRAPPTAIS